MAEMTEPTPFTDAAAVPRRGMLWPRKVLIADAMFELFAALWTLPFLFGRASILFRNPWEPESGLGDVIVKAYVASHPLLALGALAWAAKGRVRHAIVALGAVVAMRWLNYTPSLLRYGLKFNDGFDLQWIAAQVFTFPLLSACAIVLAARGERLRLATALVSLPTLYNVLGFTVFAIWTIINGI